MSLSIRRAVVLSVFISCGLARAEEWGTPWKVRTQPQPSEVAQTRTIPGCTVVTKVNGSVIVVAYRRDVTQVIRLADDGRAGLLSTYGTIHLAGGKTILEPLESTVDIFALACQPYLPERLAAEINRAVRASVRSTVIAAPPPVSPE